ncbi:MAG TPA: Flp pilus assembly protein CpaB [Rhodocyclaceae bacterium]|jgi:pilus assembly protein CpaB|nr:Flp pilus assembly protein CpaB [Rhodocyclaceae bacterium]
MALKLPPLPVNKTWMMLVIAVILAILATFLTASYLKGRENSIAEEFAARANQGGPKVSVVVPVRDLPVGTALTDGLVAARDVPADLLYPDAITVDQFDGIKNQGLIRPVTKGRPLLMADIRPMYSDFAGSLKEGTRAMTIDVDELNSVAHMVQPGNRIDLMLVMKRDDGGQTVVPFMDSMKVLATGQRVFPDSELGNANHRAQSYSNLTLEVTPTQAARLTLAQDLGKLRFTLRNEKDQQSDDFSVNAQNIMDEISARARASHAASGPSGMVEFIIGGQRSGPNAKSIDVQAPSSVTPPAPVVPPIAPQAATNGSGFDANGMTPQMKAELKNMLDK